MPVNAPTEYYKAEEKYKEAKTKAEKIKYMEEMIRRLPKHKGAENVLAQLRRRLAKLKAQKEKKKGAKPRIMIKKEGAGTVCIIGETNSGKSTLLKELTGVKVLIADYPYTTVKPKVGMMKYEDIWVQIVEIPSTFAGESMGVLHTADLVLIVIDGSRDRRPQKKKLTDLLEKSRAKGKRLFVVTKRKLDLKNLKLEIWSKLGKIRVYTKTPKKKPEKKAIIMKAGATVEDTTKIVHKDFLDHFRFARVWGDSVKFGGQSVGLEHVLRDKDIVEIHA